MKSVLRVLAPPHRCGYLPDQIACMEYEEVELLTAGEYGVRMERGWRRFGHMLFRPRCQACSACQTLRVDVERFCPNRSQRRTIRANENAVDLAIGPPQVTAAKLELYDRYHAFQADRKDWPVHALQDPFEYVRSFVHHPFATEEWGYTIGQTLVGVGYVDSLPGALSAIYFFYDPAERGRSLGTWNVLCLLREAARRRIPYLYLGYYVAGCQSMEYKAAFVPNQVLDERGQWRDFRRS